MAMEIEKGIVALIVILFVKYSKIREKEAEETHICMSCKLKEK